MAEHHRLDPAAPWIEVVTTDADWNAADPSQRRTS
jgi:2-oxoisovalerate dehydrogenase E1 component